MIKALREINGLLDQIIPKLREAKSLIKELALGVSPLDETEIRKWGSEITDLVADNLNNRW